MNEISLADLTAEEVQSDDSVLHLSDWAALAMPWVWIVDLSMKSFGGYWQHPDKPFLTYKTNWFPADNRHGHCTMVLLERSARYRLAKQDGKCIAEIWREDGRYGRAWAEAVVHSWRAEYGDAVAITRAFIISALPTAPLNQGDRNGRES